MSKTIEFDATGPFTMKSSESRLAIKELIDGIIDDLSRRSDKVFHEGEKNEDAYLDGKSCGLDLAVHVIRVHVARYGAE